MALTFENIQKSSNFRPTIRSRHRFIRISMISSCIPKRLQSWRRLISSSMMCQVNFCNPSRLFNLEESISCIQNLKEGSNSDQDLTKSSCSCLDAIAGSSVVRPFHCLFMVRSSECKASKWAGKKGAFELGIIAMSLPPFFFSCQGENKIVRLASCVNQWTSGCLVPGQSDPVGSLQPAAWYNQRPPSNFPEPGTIDNRSGHKQASKRKPPSAKILSCSSPFFPLTDP